MYSFHQTELFSFFIRKFEKPRVNVFLELMRHISLLIWWKWKTSESQSCVCYLKTVSFHFLYCFIQVFAFGAACDGDCHLNRSPGALDFFKFYITWKWWSNFGSEQFDNIFRNIFEKTIIRLHRRQLCFPPELKAAQFLSQKNHESFCTTNKHFMNYL